MYKNCWPWTLNGVMVKLWPRYGDFSIFQDGGRRHLGFSNFVNFNNRKAQEGQTALPCQISSTSVICKNRQHCTESVVAMATQVIVQYHNKIRMWSNAQRDGRPAEYRWRPLFNAAKFSWRLLLECRAATLPRCETHWNVVGCPKLANRSQPLVCRSSPYCEWMKI